MAEAICEVWHKVPGYEGLYEVSSLGQVRSLYRYKKDIKTTVTQITDIYMFNCSKIKLVKIIMFIDW